jgi:hypothetical protein
MWIPGPIYEALPYLYIAVGLTAVLALEHPLAWFCGGVLAVVGTLIAAMRRSNRNPIIGSRLK